MQIPCKQDKAYSLDNAPMNIYYLHMGHLRPRVQNITRVLQQLDHNQDARVHIKSASVIAPVYSLSNKPYTERDWMSQARTVTQQRCDVLTATSGLSLRNTVEPEAEWL